MLDPDLIEDDPCQGFDIAGYLKRGIAWANRREDLCRHPPFCEECLDPQVQLLDHTATPATWRCRRCQHTWAWEPPA